MQTTAACSSLARAGFGTGMRRGGGSSANWRASQVKPCPVGAPPCLHRGKHEAFTILLSINIVPRRAEHVIFVLKPQKPYHVTQALRSCCLSHRNFVGHDEYMVFVLEPPQSLILAGGTSRATALTTSIKPREAVPIFELEACPNSLER